jgi:hypothetical protein
MVGGDDNRGAYEDRQRGQRVHQRDRLDRVQRPRAVGRPRRERTARQGGPDVLVRMSLSLVVDGVRHLQITAPVMTRTTSDRISSATITAGGAVAYPLE